MALTGIILRRDTKTALVQDPPIDGEIVYATDTYEHGAKIGNEILWKKQFTSPSLFRVTTEAEMLALTQKRVNDFCFVEENNKIYNFFSNNWFEITDIDDDNINAFTSWSSQKQSTRTISGNQQIIELKYSDQHNVIPNASTLSYGELFVNTFDGKLFFKKNNGTMSLIEVTNSSYITNQTSPELLSSNVNDALLELASLKAPKENAFLITPNIGEATGVSFNGMIGFSNLDTDFKMNGTRSAGISTSVARADHVHPSDTSKANLLSPTFTGTPQVPDVTRGDISSKIANTKFVSNQASNVAPLMNGLVNIGTSFYFAREDHVHPNDTSKANLSGATFTGAVAGTSLNLSSSLTVGTTGSFTGALTAESVNGILGFSNSIALPSAPDVTASYGTSLYAARADHVHPLQVSTEVITTIRTEDNGDFTYTGDGLIVFSENPTFENKTNFAKTEIINDVKVQTDIQTSSVFAYNTISTTPQNLNVITAGTFTGGEIKISVKETGKAQFSKIMFTFDGTNVYLNEESVNTGTILANFDLTQSGGILTLVTTASSSVSKDYKVKIDFLR